MLLAEDERGGLERTWAAVARVPRLGAGCETTVPAVPREAPFIGTSPTLPMLLRQFTVIDGVRISHS